MDIQNSVAVVTGGASGLGEAVARALTEAGARVAVLDTQLERAESLAAELGGIAIHCNVADARSAENGFAQIRERLGLCGIAVNCAGIVRGAKIVGKEGPMPLEQFNEVIQVNLVGTFNILRLAAADMAAREANQEGERGVFVATSSIAAYEGQIGQVAYTASKAGVAGMMLQAAREFAGRGIRVNGVAPGIFMTPMMSGLPEAVQESLAANVPFPSRMGKPEEFASLVEQIISNPMINGEVIRLDAALRMAPR
ncbi:MAG: SDR family NAD(P)-dependent oxidoreductase [Gammaproteobacteria bacterium]|nr:SDR family NAD(P)-dependent oxidoreductase [Gammaproteobacteria bacterium]